MNSQDLSSVSTKTELEERWRKFNVSAASPLKPKETSTDSQCLDPAPHKAELEERWRKFNSPPPPAPRTTGMTWLALVVGAVLLVSGLIVGMTTKTRTPTQAQNTGKSLAANPNSLSKVGSGKVKDQNFPKPKPEKSDSLAPPFVNPFTTPKTEPSSKLVAESPNALAFPKPDPQSQPPKKESSSPTVSFSSPTPPKPTAPLTRQFAEQIGIKMVTVSTGQFRMGSGGGLPNSRVNGTESPDERPSHNVKISRFYMSAYEITRGQFAQFVTDTGHKTEAEANGLGSYGVDSSRKSFSRVRDRNWRNPGFTQNDDHPVVCVSWNDAQVFLRWLSRKDGRTFCLPSEAEWEYACRSGSSSKYGFGDNEAIMHEYANISDLSARRVFANTNPVYGDDGFAFTSPVGRYKPNSFGLYDMHGNVWEWCEDVYDARYYQNSTDADPIGPTVPTNSRTNSQVNFRRNTTDSFNSIQRVDRGGGWVEPPSQARSAKRGKVAPSESQNFLGFRIVSREPAPASK